MFNKIDNKKAIHNSPGDISSNKSRFGPMPIGNNADIIRKKAIAITKVDFFSRYTDISRRITEINCLMHLPQYKY